VAKARERCWRYDWVLNLDIKGFFDNIDWELMLKAGPASYGLPVGCCSTSSAG
jgi:hypothetical protein